MNSLISIGLPVFNGENCIARAIESILVQTYQNFELIISDNASQDKTQQICETFARDDSRVIYIRQNTNIGALRNFEFVLRQANGSFFTWWAADDIRNSNFLESNIKPLIDNPNIVGSTSPHRFEGGMSITSLHRFPLSGSFEDRFINFLKISWHTNAYMFSIFRTEKIRSLEFPSYQFPASDWAVLQSILCLGPIHLSEESRMILGRNGDSSQLDFYRTYRSKWIEIFLPLYSFTINAFKYLKKTSLKFRFIYMLLLVKLNYQAILNKIYRQYLMIHKKIRILK